jgi:hypothetical protein
MMMSTSTTPSEPQVCEWLAVMLVAHGIEVVHDLTLLRMKLFNAEHDGVERNAH